mgnify:CR=1 FL=1
MTSPERLPRGRGRAGEDTQGGGAGAGPAPIAPMAPAPSGGAPVPVGTGPAPRVISRGTAELAELKASNRALVAELSELRSDYRSLSAHARLQAESVTDPVRFEIGVTAGGESRPLVPTADGVREPQNRRVVIVLQ